MVNVRSSREVSDCRPRENQIVFHGKNRKRPQKLHNTDLMFPVCAEARALENPGGRTMGKKQCTHGRRKEQCKECNPCPHGKGKHYCADCTPAPTAS